ncbi:MAG: SEC-C metal-binding domain-containing protein [Desulfuromonadaceae bacterium]|nr:SEC-C metal-binding domain-containing protein [Desulfuromonadaceae bacterium]
MKTGRNDPCPCGSGLKYKKCCADKHDASEHQRIMGPVMDELKELLKGKNFGSLDEANTFLRQHNQQRNQAPSDDFHGLSPEQMHRFLYFPFDTTSLIVFPSSLDNFLQAPILSLFNLLAAAIGDDGLKATATGNLPRNFCRESAGTFLGEEEYKRWSRFGELRSEPEFMEMHTTRLVAELAGLIRKYKGKFILSRECRKLLAEQGQSGIYPRLFRAFVREYNWAYDDHLGEIPFIQQSFLFTLYLLTRYGGEWRSSIFYEDNFLQAFPNLIPQVQPVGNCYSPEQVVRLSYSARCLERFALFFGLVEIERSGNDRYSEEFRVRKLPLLDQVVQFHL